MSTTPRNATAPGSAVTPVLILFRLLAGCPTVEDWCGIVAAGLIAVLAFTITSLTLQSVHEHS
jgi:hypothetical protein